MCRLYKYLGAKPVSIIHNYYYLCRFLYIVQMFIGLEGVLSTQASLIHLSQSCDLEEDTELFLSLEV